MKPCPAHWNGATWILDVPHAVPAQCLRAAATYIFQINRDRWLAAPHGERRDAIGRALAALKAGKIEQRIAKRAGDIELFKAFASPSDRLISIPEGLHG